MQKQKKKKGSSEQSVCWNINGPPLRCVFVNVSSCEVESVRGERLFHREIKPSPG